MDRSGGAAALTLFLAQHSTPRIGTSQDEVFL